MKSTDLHFLVDSDNSLQFCAKVLTITIVMSADTRSSRCYAASFSLNSERSAGMVTYMYLNYKVIICQLMILRLTCETWKENICCGGVVRD